MEYTTAKGIEIIQIIKIKNNISVHMFYKKATLTPRNFN